jgi:hypothetical protein
MNIHQVNVSYVAEQDRLLIRINSLGGEEFRIWLTRRLGLQLLPVLQRQSHDQLQAQLSQPNPAAPPNEQRQQLVRNFQREAEVYQGDYQTPFRDQATALPLGEEPLLVTELKLTPMAAGKLQINLLEKLPQRQRDMQLVLDLTLTQGLSRLLHQAIQASGWLQGSELETRRPSAAHRGASHVI